jgi:hypothetical protein
VIGIRELWLVGVMVLGSGCMRRISDGDASGGAGSASHSDATTAGGPGASETGASSEAGLATGDAPATTAPPIICEDGYTACDGECTLLGADQANCGECGYACKGWGTTNRCSNWECEPGIWPCIKPLQGIDTCAQACASVGQTCATDAYCSDYVRVWTTASGNDNNPEATIETCERLIGGNTSFLQGCDEPIDWGYEVAGKTVLGVACCCTQD